MLKLQLYHWSGHVVMPSFLFNDLTWVSPRWQTMLDSIHCLCDIRALIYDLKNHMRDCFLPVVFTLQIISHAVKFHVKFLTEFH